MNIKLNKWLLLLPMMMLVIGFSSIVAKADTSTTENNTTFTNDYSVQIPATLELSRGDGNDYSGTYTVGVKGNIATDVKVCLSP